MSLYLTLFGGMLATAVLYWAGHRGRLSNFWAATLACALPCFAYLAHALAIRPGLDVVTLHLVAYPTVALLLHQLYGEKAGHDRAMHWAPRLMVAFFVALTVLFGSFVYIASHGLPPTLAGWLLPGAKGKNLHTGFAGVVEHGGEAAKGIGHHLKVDERLARLGWEIEVAGLQGLAAGQRREVSVRVLDRTHKGVDDLEVRLALGRPGQPAGAGTPLTGSGTGGYLGTLSAAEAGTWVAWLTLSGRGEKLTLEHTLEVR